MLIAAVSTAIIACNAPSVHDGDTLRCGPDRIRLFGVDAPEVRRAKRPPSRSPTRRGTNWSA